MRLRFFLLPLLLLIAACAGRQIAPGSGAVPSTDDALVRYSVQGSGSPALLFIHCWACDSSYWDAQVARFREDHLVVTVDLPGHGASGLRRGDWTVPAFAADVGAVVEALALTDVVLVGSSMGGSVALEAAALMPDRITGVVGVDAFHDFAALPADQVDAFLAPLRADFPAATEQFVRDMLFHPTADPALVERVATDMAAAPPEPSLRMIEGLLAYGPDAVRAARRRAPVPVAVINGTIAPTNTAGLAAYLGEPHVVVLDGVGHFPMLEAPERFAEALEAALRAIHPGR